MNLKPIKKGEAFLMLLLFSVAYLVSLVPRFAFLSFVSFIPLLYMIQRCTSTRQSFQIGYIFGLPFFTIIFFWANNAHMALFCSSVLYHALYLGLFSAYGYIINQNLHTKRFSWLLLSSAWAATEYIRSLGFLAMPVGYIGYQLTALKSISQLASVIGVYGLSFFVFLINVLIFRSITADTLQRRLSRAIFIVMFIAAAHCTGALMLKSSDTLTKVNIAIVQGNIDTDTKWNVDFLDHTINDHIALSKISLKENPSLIVWPETSVPTFLFHPQRDEQLKRIQSFVRDINVPLLLGTQMLNIDSAGKAAFNLAAHFSAQGRPLNKYAKIKLIPFAERTPAKWMIPLFRRWGLMSIYQPGNEKVVFDNGNFRFSTHICFETFFPQFIRHFVTKGSDIIINITNDAPSLGTMSLYYTMTSNMNILRAIENRRSVVRAANNGISAFIDPYGRVLKSTSLSTKSQITASMPISSQTTAYNRFGYLLIYFFAAISLAGLLGRKTSLKH